MKDLLVNEGYRFDFFQAVRLLERLAPDREAVGRDGPPAREVARFRTKVGLAFPASEIHEIKDGAGDESPPEVTVAFFGMTGPLGVLPQAYTELLIERLRHRDRALWEFLDLFHHRLISLFYRAWEKYRFTVGYEQDRSDPFTQYLFDLVGLGTAGLRGRMAVADEGLLLWAGLIAQQPHSASALQSILRDDFGVPVTVDQFMPQWLPLEGEHRSRLGAANSSPGTNLVCGARVRVHQSKFRLRLGPLTYREFVSFLPTGLSFRPITDVARFLAGLEFDFDVQLVLKAAEVPACELSSAAERPPMLGWTTWLKTGDLKQDATQVVLAVAN